MASSIERAVDLLLDRWRLHVTGDAELVDDVTTVMVPPCSAEPATADGGAQWTVRVERDPYGEAPADPDTLANSRPVLAYPNGSACLAVTDSSGGLLRLAGRYRPGIPPALLEVDHGRRTTRVVVSTSESSPRWPDWLARLFFSSRMLSGGWRMLHASAVALNGVAVLFVASTHGGKSTLAHRACMEMGARFMADDLVLISPEGVVAGWPTRVAIPAELAELGGFAGGGMPDRQVVAGVLRQRVLLTPQEHRAAVRPSPPTRLGALVQIGTAPGSAAGCTLEPAQAEEAAADAGDVPLQRLYSTDLLSVTGGPPPGAPGVPAPPVGSVLAGVPAVRLTVSHLRDLPYAPVWETLAGLLPEVIA
ncbi:hypothetical protein [Streptosporangium pseudovulgare]|uniref:Serine kinase n=1 Tax=Streptosporangium pseudovulgare TaxID=35765 RepID=A0ABQ2R1T7_9ACTN|nr:hypothetical protein [Streptosporangium pseudovulgare]GGQ09022.1 hypothetical protein GCM10010140_43970 [Streptosporangium pseudovulgare]